jgi:hypothetical protein
MMQGNGVPVSTLRDLISLAGSYSFFLSSFFAGLPVSVYAVSFLHSREEGGDSPWKYIYSCIVYFACVPGIFSSVLIAYSLLFTGENLLDVSFLIYFMPIISMTVTLMLLQRNVGFDQIPGFDRLSGLMVMIGAAFAIVFVLSRTRIWLVFGGSIFLFFGLAVLIFALLKWGSYLVFRKKDPPVNAST